MDGSKHNSITPVIFPSRKHLISESLLLSNRFPSLVQDRVCSAVRQSQPADILFTLLMFYHESLQKLTIYSPSHRYAGSQCYLEKQDVRGYAAGLYTARLGSPQVRSFVFS